MALTLDLSQAERLRHSSHSILATARAQSKNVMLPTLA